MFDVRITDTNSPSYINMSPQNVLSLAETEEKRKYSNACEAHHCNFTPLCFSIDGFMGRESKCFLKRLADRLSTVWNLPYSQSMTWVRTQISFAMLRATNLYIRETLYKWRGMCTEDGSRINPTIVND